MIRECEQTGNKSAQMLTTEKVVCWYCDSREAQDQKTAFSQESQSSPGVIWHVVSENSVFKRVAVFGRGGE